MVMKDLGQNMRTLASRVEFCFLGLGVIWSWEWSAWGVVSELANEGSFGFGSSPAWLPAALTEVSALLVFGWLISKGLVRLGNAWIAASAGAATLGTVFAGVLSWLGIESAAASLCAGVLIGVSTALFYLLWTECLMRAPHVNTHVVIPACAAATAIPIVVISGATVYASWAFACVLPIISGGMLYFAVKKDTLDQAAQPPTKGAHSVPSARRFVAMSATVLFLSALLGVPSGSSNPAVLALTIPVEGAYALISTAVALAIAIRATRKPATAEVPAFLRWATMFAITGALLYLQPFDALLVVGVGLSRIADCILFIAIFEYAVFYGRNKKIPYLVYVVGLLAAAQLGSLIGNVGAGLFGGAFNNAGEFVSICVFACLLMVSSTFMEELRSAVPVLAASARNTTNEAIAESCSAIARTYALAPRQRDVLAQLAAGRTVARSAEALGLSENTVASYAKQIYARLGVHSKQELIDFVFAFEIESR